MTESISPYVGSGQPEPLEAFTSLYLQLIKHCSVETRLWFDIKQYDKACKRSSWTDIDVLGIGKDSAYIVQCKSDPQEKPEVLEKQFRLMYNHAQSIHRDLLQRKKLYFVLTSVSPTNKKKMNELERRLSESKFHFLGWRFGKMAEELIWYVNKHCQNRRLKLDNPMTWLLRNLVYEDLIIEEAWYDDNWKKNPIDKRHSELWNKVEKEVYNGRKHRKRLWRFVRRAASNYVECARV